MQMVVLAGGQRSTISNEPEGIPKTMLQIGGRPLIWHILKHASNCGINDFVICGGYKIESIKEYFMDFYIYQSDIMVDTGKNKVEILKSSTENWNVTIADTGIDTLPANRVRQVLDKLEDDFLITYGDCLSDISLKELADFHSKDNRLLTVALARPTGRNNPLRFFGEAQEMNSNNEAWTSAGTFVAKKELFNSLNRDGDIEELTIGTNPSFFRHKGFFSAIETRRDKVAAEEMWNAQRAPWMEII